MSTEAKVDFAGIVFRKTNAGTGRQLAVTPENSAMKHLAYARVILNSATPYRFPVGHGCTSRSGRPAIWRCECPAGLSTL
jgi:hypothetical protein